MGKIGRASTPKMTPFMAFMSYKRKQMEKNGRRFPRGWRDVSHAVHSEWSVMDEQTKKSWGTVKNEPPPGPANVNDSDSQFQRKIYRPQKVHRVKSANEQWRYWAENQNQSAHSSVSNDNGQTQDTSVVGQDNYDGEWVDNPKRMRLVTSPPETSSHEMEDFKVEVKFERGAEVRRDNYADPAASSSRGGETDTISYVPNPLFCSRRQEETVDDTKLFPNPKRERFDAEETATSSHQQQYQQQSTGSEEGEIICDYANIKQEQEPETLEWIPQGSGADPGVVLCKEIPDWSLKWVQRVPEYEYEFEKIRAYFDSVTDDEQFLALKFSYVHFNEYCATSMLAAYVPAEFCCVRWSLLNGLEWFGGSQIDPGHSAITDWVEASNNCHKFSLPQPSYTYKRGVAYSVGEDRYEEILKSIFLNSTSFTLPYTRIAPPWRYIFVAEKNMPVTMGCLTWLMAHCGKNLRLCILSAERFVGELMRTCQIRRYAIDLKADVVKQMEQRVKLGTSPPEQPPEVVELPPMPKLKHQSAFHKSVLNGMASSEFGGKILHETTPLDNRMRLGCIWHQREDCCGSISFCSTTICKKWVLLTQQKALDIMDRDFQQIAGEISKLDMKPQPWTEMDGMGVEARQRFGFYGNISATRVEVLEDDFVFPDLLKELRKRMPHGLKRKPTRIIWPLHRDIEQDLNWSPLAPFYITDTNPQERAHKRAAKEAQFRQLQQRIVVEEDW